MEKESSKTVREEFQEPFEIKNRDGNSFVIASELLRSIYVKLPLTLRALAKDLSRGKSVSFLGSNEIRGDRERQGGPLQQLE